MGIQALSTGVRGPPPPGTMGLLLGRANALLRGVRIHPGLVNPDSEGEIRIMASVERGVVVIPAGDRIAQLILIPVVPCDTLVLKEKREGQCLGETGASAFWVATLNKRPQLTLKVEDRSFTGILDTGADVSVLAEKHWPKSWPKQAGTATLQGIGQAIPQKSAKILKWRDPEGQTGYFQPYVLPGLPVNLWGRDILEDMGVILTTQSSSSVQKATRIMQKMGWAQGKGLGKSEQGLTSTVADLPTDTRAPKDKRGLGHF